MAFNFLFTKSGEKAAPVVVAFGLTASLRKALSQLIAPFHLQLYDHVPENNYYILALAPAQLKPVQIPVFIPVVHLDDTDLHSQIAQALLYLEAHDDIRQ